MNILVLNAGSSSLKSCLYLLNPAQLPLEPMVPIWTGQIDWNVGQQVVFSAKKIDGKPSILKRPPTSPMADIQYFLSWIWHGDTQVIQSLQEIDVVGHRVVHGGDKYHQPILITSEVQAEIDRLSVFAPLHNPVNLMGIQAISALFSELPQVAVFDTAFYGNLPEVAYVYPLPYAWLAKGIRKYGFHGISHQYCTQRGAQLLDRNLEELRLISCHLGNGCSLAAVKNGRCIDTTMGFTPLDGLMMGTRCGSIDPGIILHLLRENEYTVAELDHILNSESGLLGVSGVSNDLRKIDQAIENGNSQAALSQDLYIHLLSSKIASLLPALGGVDALIFTGGVGENHVGIRAAVASKLAFLGVEIDPVLNSRSSASATRNDYDISASHSPIKVLIIHTQEEWQIAKDCCQFLQPKT